MFGGPGTLRFFLQPAIAVLLGVLHGVHDQQHGRLPFFKGVWQAHGHRLQQLREGPRQILLPLVVAVAASALFQFLIRRRIHVALALAYAALFVAVPYLVARSLANRLSARRLARKS
jgi:hypothetical protein